MVEEAMVFRRQDGGWKEWGHLAERKRTAALEARLADPREQLGRERGLRRL